MHFVQQILKIGLTPIQALFMWVGGGMFKTILCCQGEGMGGGDDSSGALLTYITDKK